VKAVANHELICSWLGLSPEEWPPNHYALLGLPVGEPDLERIQQRIHERMSKVRPYQVKHPEQVTEAMNRIAQAYTVLTDMSAKRVYDAELQGHAPLPAEGEPSAAEQIRAAVAEYQQATQTPPEKTLSPEEQIRAAVAEYEKEEAARAAQAKAASAAEQMMTALAEQGPGAGTAPGKEGADPLSWLHSSTPPAPPAVAAPTQGDWRQAPPPAQADWRQEPPPPQVESAPSVPVEAAPMAVEEAPVVPEPVAPAPPPTPAPPPVDPILEAAQLSPAARRGLATRGGLYHRIQRTRHLLSAWRQVGSFLNQPKRRLTKAADAAELTEQLNAILEILEGFPAILGGAGQPGNYIVTLARVPTFIPSFRALSLSQREELARDWRAGRDLLLAHEDFLAQEVRAFRKIGRWGRFVRATKALYADHPAFFLLFVSLVTLLIAIIALRRWKG